MQASLQMHRAVAIAAVDMHLRRGMPSAANCDGPYAQIAEIAAGHKPSSTSVSRFSGKATAPDGRGSVPSPQSIRRPGSANIRMMIPKSRLTSGTVAGRTTCGQVGSNKRTHLRMGKEVSLKTGSDQARKLFTNGLPDANLVFQTSAVQIAQSQFGMIAVRNRVLAFLR